MLLEVAEKDPVDAVFVRADVGCGRAAFRRRRRARETGAALIGLEIAGIAAVVEHRARVDEAQAVRAGVRRVSSSGSSSGSVSNITALTVPFSVVTSGCVWNALLVALSMLSVPPFWRMTSTSAPALPCVLPANSVLCSVTCVVESPPTHSAPPASGPGESSGAVRLNAKVELRTVMLPLATASALPRPFWCSDSLPENVVFSMTLTGEPRSVTAAK